MPVELDLLAILVVHICETVNKTLTIYPRCVYVDRKK